MDHKTISHLNSKAWYRLVKVLFGICLLIVLGGYNFVVFSLGTTQVDQKETTIYCNLNQPGETKPPFSPASVGIAFSNSDFTDNQFDYKNYFVDFNDFAIEAISKQCYPTMTTSDIYSLQEEADILNKLGLIDSQSTVVAYKNLTRSQQEAYNADYNVYQQETSSLFGNEKAKYLDFSHQLFNVTPVFSSTIFWELFLIGNFVILLIFEAIRRIFYYIVLGSLKPGK